MPPSASCSPCPSRTAPTEPLPHLARTTAPCLECLSPAPRTFCLVNSFFKPQLSLNCTSWVSWVVGWGREGRGTLPDVLQMRPAHLSSHNSGHVSFRTWCQQGGSYPHPLLEHGACIHSLAYSFDELPLHARNGRVTAGASSSQCQAFLLVLFIQWGLSVGIITGGTVDLHGP